MSQPPARTLCHVVPATPPEFNGVGDYAHRLWEYWPDPRPEWHVAALRIPEGAQDHYPGVALHPFEPNPSSLFSALRASGAETVFLHYVPHAYHPKGVPFWLLRALREYKDSPGKTIFIVFHELFATGPLWTTSGLLSPLAKRLHRRLTALADRWATSTERYFNYVISHTPTSKEAGILVPVGPNIIPGDAAKRPRARELSHPLRVVSFGSAGTRLLSLNLHSGLLRRLNATNAIAELSLVGSAPSDLQQRETQRLIEQLELGERTTHHFDLSPEAVSGILSECDVALIPTKLEWLGKSGVYATAAAHHLRVALPGDAEIPERSAHPLPTPPTWPEICASLCNHMG